MKIKLVIMIALLMSLASCNSSETPEDVAERVLKELHNEWIEKGVCSLTPFNMALVSNAQAKAFMNGKDIPTRSILVDSLFQIDEPCFSWEFDSVIESTTDLYRLSDFTWDKGGKNEGLMYKEYLDLFKKEGGEFNGQKLCKITETAAVILEYKDVPLYLIRYKVDSRHVDFVGDEYNTATVGVIKHPEEGYKVVYFMWDN